MTLAERVDQLARQHGSLRAAARVVGIDPAYFFRLHSGEKIAPSVKTLRKLGLVKEVSYRLAARGQL